MTRTRVSAPLRLARRALASSPPGRGELSVRLRVARGARRAGGRRAGGPGAGAAGRLRPRAGRGLGGALRPGACARAALDRRSDAVGRRARLGPRAHGRRARARPARRLDLRSRQLLDRRAGPGARAGMARGVRRPRHARGPGRRPAHAARRPDAAQRDRPGARRARRGDPRSGVHVLGQRLGWRPRAFDRQLVGRRQSACPRPRAGRRLRAGER